ncbi:MAG: hypothetical protein QOH71_69 [Blastocatellia bacterium]|nr:hypothetical protein [Blastocatellia bacterium]
MPFVVVFLACGVIGMIGLAAVNHVGRKGEAKSHQGSPIAVQEMPIYEPFRSIRESHPKLGAALQKEDLVENKATNKPWFYLARYDCAYIIWDTSFFQLAINDCEDHKANTWKRAFDFQKQGKNYEIGKQYSDENWLRKHFKTPSDSFPPFGGVAQGFDWSPKQWTWIGNQIWQTNLCGVVKQEFEGGRIYAAVPIHGEGNPNLKALILMYDNKDQNEGVWDYQEVFGITAPRLHDPYKAAKNCWEY